jgi:hypothetical protein
MVLTNPGEDVFLVRGDKKLAPFQIYRKLEKGDLSTEEWQKMCSEFGISNLEL